MIYSIFPKADTTCYERHPNKNTGLDEILELEKIVSSSTIAGLYNTRILIDFDLYNLSQSLNAEGINPGKFYLNLYIADVNTPEPSSLMYHYPQNHDWVSGIGKSTHNPETKDGASWNYRTGTSAWSGSNGPTTSSLDPDLKTILEFDSKDIRADLTSLITGSWGISNNPGIIIKRPLSQEQDGKRYGYAKFFSNDTSTVYRPKLDICYNDHSWVTGSLSALDTTKDCFVYLKNNYQSLKIDSTVKFRFEAREKYPPKTYGTSTSNLETKYFPSSSYYSLVDYKTGDVVIPFDTTFTKISCDATGNYANLKLSGLYPDRLYKFNVRIDNSDGTTKYHDIDHIFKVVE